MTDACSIAGNGEIYFPEINNREIIFKQKNNPESCLCLWLSLFCCCCAAAAIAIAGAVELPIVAVLFAKEESAVIAMEVGAVLAYSRLLPQILKNGN